MNEFTFSQKFTDWRTGELIKTYNMCVKDETLGEIIEDFEMFLKGCGYQFPEGSRLDICFEDEPSNLDLSDISQSPTFEEFDAMWPSAHYGHDIKQQGNK